MKIIRYFIFLMIGVFGLSLSEANAQKSTSPRTVEQKVFKEILKMPYYGVFDNIKFQLSGDTVILSGKVAEARNKKDAERFVKDVDGVKNVVNNIEILPLSSFDNQIRRNILREFSAKGLYRYLWEPNPSVRIIVDNGRVELEGFVANRGDFNLMNILSQGVFGVFNVENNLIIEKERVR